MRLAFLGTSAAIPSPWRDTTALVFEVVPELVLVDCGGSPVQKLRRLGLDPLRLTRIVITHTHPDHAYGLPALVQNLILLGRRAPLPIHCRAEHVETLRGLLGLFRLLDREDAFPVPLHGVEPRAGRRLLETGALTLTASPNAHGAMPNLALRLEGDGAVVVYSSDTRPCEAVVELARGADLLIHEATFAERDRERAGWHSTAREAGEVARAAGVRRLLLAHVDAPYHEDLAALTAEARRVFPGEVEVAEELRWYTP
ncbi:MAG: MBL fold metallo-hydrolase [Candidatus Rokubacteria bacterium]|nr:MBL fold metallo-hydrolase [Candidatus Rokubacteria bacterium]